MELYIVKWKKVTSPNTKMVCEGEVVDDWDTVWTIAKMAISMGLEVLIKKVKK